MLELRKRAGRPCVQEKSATAMVPSAANGPPTAFWQIRQWQTPLTGCAYQA